jgi:hypothetical protein
MADLLLDSQIRDWVLLPIVLVVFLIGLLRHYATLAMKTEVKTDETALRQSQVLLRSRLLRENANYISPRAFREKRELFNNKEKGLLTQKPENTQMMAMLNPANMTDMMKKNALMIVPNLVMFTWLSYFFSGFVIAKVPFPLASRFRSMLQRGIELSSLDVTYVTSLSMYVIILFGLGGVYSLVLGEANEADDATLMQQQQQMASQGVDMVAAYKAEMENLELIEHNWLLNDSESYIMTM